MPPLQGGEDFLGFTWGSALRASPQAVTGRLFQPSAEGELRGSVRIRPPRQRRPAMLFEKFRYGPLPFPTSESVLKAAGKRTYFGTVTTRNPEPGTNERRSRHVMKTVDPFTSLLTTHEPPQLGPGPRPGVQPLQPLQVAIDAAFAKGPPPQLEREAARGLVLLWHDHFDAAHDLVQHSETSGASYVHAILHRREPDYSNAKYWFRRVRQHPCYEPLARAAEKILQSSGAEALASKLLPGGKWDAFAFVDACEEAASGRGSAKTAGALRQVQAAEFALLLEHLVRQ